MAHAYLREMLAASPGLTNAFWRETLIHAAIYREWVENLGARPGVAQNCASTVRARRPIGDGWIAG